MVSTEQSHYSKLKRTIVAIMILVPMVPFVLVVTIGYYTFRTSLESNTLSKMKRIVEDHRQMIDSFLSERKADLEFILQSYDFQALSDPDLLRGVFHRLQKQSAAFVDLGVFNAAGLHVAYQGPYELEGKVYSEAPWFKEVLKKGYYVSDVFLGYRRVPHFVIALSRNDREKAWVIRATIDTYTFNALVRKIRIGKTGEAYLLNAEGLFQTERRSGGNLMEKDPEGFDFSPSDPSIRTSIRRSDTGTPFLYATTWLEQKPWLLVVRQEKEDAFAALHSASYLIFLVIVLGGAAIVIVALYMTGRIIRRMEGADREKDQLGEQLIRASRLAELGEMAAGFAHEINNPLQIMKSEQTLMAAILSDLREKGDLKPSKDVEELEDSIDQVRLQIERCAHITQGILKFGRRSEPVAEDLDLHEFLPSVTGMVANKADVHGIAFGREIGPDRLRIHGDPGQIQQVLLNLLNNAIDAIVTKHGSAGGELVVGAAADGPDRIRIWVQDNGCGIAPENLKRVFSPFFTTKPVGKGTGLGLSVCYGIIDRMGGIMEVSSEKGVGTTFTVRLPAAP